jgi:hypothetical protein
MLENPRSRALPKPASPARPRHPFAAVATVLALAASAAAACAAAPAAAQVAGAPAPVRAQFDSAYFAWDRGDYLASLAHAERVLTAPGGEALLGPVALLTGERYRVREVARDGRALRWSPDGSLALYETGATASPRTHVVAVGPDTLREVAAFAGRSATVSPDGRRVAYLRVAETPELAAAREAERQALAARDGATLQRVRGEIARMEAAAARVDGDAAPVEIRRTTLPLAEIAADPLPGRDWRGRTRLFHNNTLRTVAPQYEWEPSPDGSRVLVVADRDGDTSSGESGVFVVALDRPVTLDEVLARIRANLAAERDLRVRGRRLFAPIEAEVRAAVAEVDVGRVHDHAHALYQFGTKWFTAPGNALAVEYLANAFRQMGYEAELQWFEPRPGHRSANVVATLRGTTHPERINVVSSHFDSVEGSPGADDNTSGTTALLEAARVLANRPQRETIRFALLTAEEAGLLGAHEFVRRARADGDRIVAVINNDMIGWTRSHRLDNTIRYSNSAIRDLQHAAAIHFTDLITYDARYVRGTDAHVFYDAYGDVIGGVGSYPILGNPHYHQRHDVLEVIDQRLVAEVSRATVAAIMRLAHGSEEVVEPARRD